MLKLLPLCLILFVLGCAHAGPDRLTREQTDIRLDLAERYLIEGESRLALEQLRTVDRVAPHNPRLHFNLGLAYTALEEWENAAGSFKQALKIRPDYGEAWNNLGQVRMAQGRPDQARQAYKQALAQKEYMTPEFAAYNLASLYYGQEELEEALKYAQESFRKNRRFGPGYVLAGHIHREKGMYEMALHTFEQGVRARPDNAQLTLLLAEELVRSGRINEARQWFNRVVEIDGDSSEAQLAEYYLEALR